MSDQTNSNAHGTERTKMFSRPRSISILPAGRPDHDSPAYDEFDAMRDAHAILCNFDEPARRRIMEAVSRRLDDATAKDRHQRIGN
jgi:hypothetical protein